MHRVVERQDSYDIYYILNVVDKVLVENLDLTDKSTCIYMDDGSIRLIRLDRFAFDDSEDLGFLWMT